MPGLPVEFNRGARYVAVVGSSKAGAEQVAWAEAVGRGVGEAGAVLVCGGGHGVMAAACRGASRAGGMTIGILPGDDREAANAWVGVALATGLGELRNGLIVRAADVMIAIGGEYGTLSEVALALKAAVPVVGLSTWEIQGVEAVATPRSAVARALALASDRSRG